MIRSTTAKFGLAATVLVAALVLGIVAGRARAARTSSRSLVGTFKLAAGHVSGGTVTGSYFRMVYPGGTLTGGKFFKNPDSATPDKTYTLVKPGTSGGLVTGSFQPAPTPAFDTKGNSRATSIIVPQRFAQIAFGLSTSSRDPATGKSAPAPSIQVTNGKLSGQVEAVVASWNKLYFNQGSPKPGGARPGLTASVTGTYNARSRAFVLQWASSIVGGPFNGFTGYWHLQGTFVPGH